MKATILGALVSILVAGCGGGDKTNDDGGPVDAGTDDGGADDAGPGEGLPVISAFGAEPAGLTSGGGTVNLSWTVSDADTLSVDQDVGLVSGSNVEVTVAETTTFTLTATNSEGMVSRSATVLVASDEPPPFERGEGESSADVIAEALAVGEINDVDALRYKVFALFGDARLPVQFEAEGRIHGTPIMKELAVRFAQLPPAVQDELTPFRLSPTDPLSWYAGYTPVEGRRGKQAGVFDRHVDVADERVRVWWESSLGNPTQTFIESVVSSAVASSYDKLVDYMGRPALPHLTFPDLDPETYHVFVVINESNSDLGWNTTNNFSAALGGYPSHVVINLSAISGNAQSGLAGLTKLAAATAAHELMHAIQNNFDTKDANTMELNWLEESTATWAENFVYKDFDTEHSYAKRLMHEPELALDVDSGAHVYGGYLLHMFLQDRTDMNVVSRIWDQTESGKLVFEALNAAIGDKLAQRWGEFTAYNWNDGPVPFHRDQDGLTVTVGDNGNEVEIENAEVLARQEEYEMTLSGASAIGPILGVDYLSAQYFHFDLTDPSVHSVLFANGYTFDLDQGTPQVAPADLTFFATELSAEQRKGGEVYLLVKSNGSWLPEPRRVTDVAFIPFCQDYASERVDELVVIFSNGRFEEGERTPLSVQGLQPRLFVSNVSCGDWVGDGAAFTAIETQTRMQTTSVDFQNLLFERPRYTLEELFEGEGQVNFQGTILPEESSPLSFARYSVEIVDVDWATVGSVQSGDQTCNISGSGLLSAADAQLTFFELRPTLLGPTGDGGSIYRSFFANMVFMSPGADVVTDCGPDGLDFEQFNTGIIGGRRNLEFGTLEVDEDGDAINQAWELGDTTYSLNLLGFSE